MRNKHTDLSANQTIREAIKRISLRGVVSKDKNFVRGTEKIIGYVSKIHTDDDLAGTVDVQEYVQMAVTDSQGLAVGLHVGVFLSAIQNNSKGFLIIPKLYSDVVVSQDPQSGEEFVTMYSHVDVIQLDSHDTISLGVKEREPFDENDENSADVDELEETGVFTNTTYKKDSISTVAQGAEAENHTSQVIDSTQISHTAGDDKSSVVIRNSDIIAKHGDSVLQLTDSESVLKQGSSEVNISDNTVFLGSKEQTDDAVLGVELANILSEIMSVLGQLITPTMMGPQPPANVASFISLKAKIDSFKSTHTGFLTKKVKIQK